jgi:hypothetical protein
MWGQQARNKGHVVVNDMQIAAKEDVYEIYDMKRRAGLTISFNWSVRLHRAKKLKYESNNQLAQRIYRKYGHTP